MKDVYELLRQKELEISRLEIEVEALRVVAPLLSENQEVSHDDQPTSTHSLTPRILWAVLVAQSRSPHNRWR